ncbi:MAG: c-type cytochrome, partial [Proteobacteria bacterium]|nr:c-type cytochrome [Pseudomonadota bacterium]
ADGRGVYQRHCAICHGERGDGEGRAAARLTVKPTDFRMGLFKFRSTPSGSTPRNGDLERTLLAGVRGTGMVSQRHLTAAERGAVIEYVKTLSPRFAEHTPRDPVAVPPAAPCSSRAHPPHSSCTRRPPWPISNPSRATPCPNFASASSTTPARADSCPTASSPCRAARRSRAPSWTSTRRCSTRARSARSSRCWCR